MRHLASVFGLISLVTLGGCELCTDPTTAPPCYTGVVMGETCQDGVVIKVDSRYPIGKCTRLPFSATDTITYPNIIAATGTGLGPNLAPGTTVYFTVDENVQYMPQMCTMQNPTIQLPVPHLGLTNVSLTACFSSSAN
jgi:hypothetical protein